MALESIETYQRRATATTPEHRLLSRLIVNFLHNLPVPENMATRPLGQESIDEQGRLVYALKRQRQLTRSQVLRLLDASINKGRLSTERMGEYGALTVQGIAWSVLVQPFSLDSDASAAIINALDSDNPTICATAALLLQNCKTLASGTRETSARKIVALLDDETLAWQPLDVPPTLPITRLDDLLFETLKVLAR
jgi:hypothetical protein